MVKQLARAEPEQTAFEFDATRSNETVGGAVIEAIAQASGTDPLEIEPLYDVLDPDALDALFTDPLTGASRDGDIAVTFRLAGYEVTVWSYGRIHLVEHDS